MKKLFLFLTLLLSLTATAQREVTEFMGIRIDGSPKDMVQQLLTKGFQEIPGENFLQGEFNGENVFVYIHTHHGKVWRIALYDQKTRNESEIKTRYNHLCNQFLNNPGYYLHTQAKPNLSEDEDIHHQITVEKKQYQATFAQKPTFFRDSIVAKKYGTQLIEEILQKKYKMSTDSLHHLSSEKSAPIIADVKKSISEKVFENLKNRTVWFTINQEKTGYRITLFYENNFNEAHK